MKYLLTFLLCFGLGMPAAFGQTPAPWTLKQTKEMANFKVEVFERHSTGKFPIVEAMKLRIVPKAGGSVTEYTGKWLNIDPQKFIKNFAPDKNLDITGSGKPKLWVQDFSGGAHCCYQYVLFELDKSAKRLAKLKLLDCGEQIEITDLKQDGQRQLLTCDARFTYLGENSFAASPFPPAVYAFKDGAFQNVTKDFPQVLQQDLAKQQAAFKTQQEADQISTATVLQIFLDQFFLGKTGSAWEFFEKHYTKSDKLAVKTQLQEKLGVITPVLDKPAPAVSPPAMANP